MKKIHTKLSPMDVVLARQSKISAKIAKLAARPKRRIKIVALGDRFIDRKEFQKAVRRLEALERRVGVKAGH